jgi:DNA-binding IclR family transcriptional regulator
VRGRDQRSAIDKALALLVCFGPRGEVGLGVSELARRTGLSKSTAFRILMSLESNGAVERLGSAYRLGPRILNLSYSAYPSRYAQLSEVLTPHLVDLYEVSRQTVHLAVLYGSQVLYINKLYGHSRASLPSRIGARMPAYCTAVGKALMAFTPPTEHCNSGPDFPVRTAFTVSNVAELDRQLTEIRTSGIAHDHQECFRGLSCVGMPIFDAGGSPVAAMSISAPTAGFGGAEHAQTLRHICAKATRSLRSVALAPVASSQTASWPIANGGGSDAP